MLDFVSRMNNENSKDKITSTSDLLEKVYADFPKLVGLLKADDGGLMAVLNMASVYGRKPTGMDPDVRVLVRNNVLDVVASKKTDRALVEALSSVMHDLGLVAPAPPSEGSAPHETPA